MSSKSNRTYTNLLVDITIFAAFLIATAPRFSGLAVHEWLSIAFGAAIVVHLLLHWRWIVSTTQRLFSTAPNQARLSYAINLALFIDMTVVIFTGLMVSEIALPSLGLNLAGGRGWMGLHRTASDVAVILLGFHVALSWRWIVGVVKNLWARLVAPRPQLVPVPIPVESARPVRKDS